MISEVFLRDIRKQSLGYKDLADRSMSRLSDEQFFELMSVESNSIALIVKHMSGNFRSRWRDFLTTDGEKEDRNRDSEFIIEEKDSRESLMALWESGWGLFLAQLSELGPRDLGKTIEIRKEPFLVLEAVNRAALHVAFHVGQIVFIAKSLQGSNWESLSIAKGDSEKWRSAER